MKRALVILALLALSGCAGLSVNADLVLTYRSDVPLGQRGK